jgi:hypothetical protein
MRREWLRRKAKALRAGDREYLSGVLDYVGRDSGFKTPLLGSLSGSYDWQRQERVVRLITDLTEEEILWLEDSQ